MRNDYRQELQEKKKREEIYKTPIKLQFNDILLTQNICSQVLEALYQDRESFYQNTDCDMEYIVERTDFLEIISKIVAIPQILSKVICDPNKTSFELDLTNSDGDIKIIDGVVVDDVSTFYSDFGEDLTIPNLYFETADEEKLRIAAKLIIKQADDFKSHVLREVLQVAAAGYVDGSFPIILLQSLDKKKCAEILDPENENSLLPQLTSLFHYAVMQKNMN
ncbi:MAG TPA: hypothetical protein VI861_02160, partial [Rickettsiales bacterium]|nr:hypothetical protein [Rickettsiales bacterium]